MHNDTFKSVIDELRSDDEEMRNASKKALLDALRITRDKKAFTDKDVPYSSTALLDVLLDVAQSKKTDKIVVLNTIEWAVELYARGYNNISIYVDKHDAMIEQCARLMGCDYKNNILSDKYMSKDFDTVLCNPPYHQMVVRVPGGKETKIPLAKKFSDVAFNLLKPGGVLGMVNSNVIIGGGQQSILPLIADKDIIMIDNAALGKRHFAKIALGICVIVVRNAPGDGTYVLSTAEGKKVVNITDFVYDDKNGPKPMVPRYLANTADTELLTKIMAHKADKFQFRSSINGKAGRGAYWGFRAVNKITANPSNFHYSNEPFSNGISHPCGSAHYVSEEAVRSVFCSEIFHWVISRISGAEAADRPAAISHFPVIPLGTVYTFDTLAGELNLTQDERAYILEWAGASKWFPVK